MNKKLDREQTFERLTVTLKEVFRLGLKEKKALWFVKASLYKKLDVQVRTLITHKDMNVNLEYIKKILVFFETLLTEHCKGLVKVDFINSEKLIECVTIELEKYKEVTDSLFYGPFECLLNHSDSLNQKTLKTKPVKIFIEEFLSREMFKEIVLRVKEAAVRNKNVLIYKECNLIKRLAKQLLYYIFDAFGSSPNFYTDLINKTIVELNEKICISFCNEYVNRLNSQHFIGSRHLVLNIKQFLVELNLYYDKLMPREIFEKYSSTLTELAKKYIIIRLKPYYQVAIRNMVDSEQWEEANRVYEFVNDDEVVLIDLVDDKVQ